MKKLLMCVLILGTIRLTAQEQKEVQVIPELQEWYSWKGGFTGAYISYLPDFDSVGGGLHTITQGRDGDGVWYNRFPFDTLSQFRWKSQGSYAVYHADFNSDGIQDYFDFKGRIYTSLKKKTKPNPEPVIQIQRGGTVRPLIGDLNADGYDDLLAFNDDNYFDVILGKKELNQIKSVTVKYPAPSVYVGGYITEQGKPRIVTFESNEISEAFYLYDVQITNSGETPTVQLKKLDEIVKFRENKDDRFYEPLSLRLLVHTGKNEITIHAIRSKQGYSEIWKIENDKFSAPHKSSRFGTTAASSLLTMSITGKGTEDYIQPFASKSEMFHAVYSSAIWSDTIPKAKIPYNSKYDWLTFTAIGDVNGDGINDVAGGYDYGCVIYLGVNSLNMINETSINDFAVFQNVPNPVDRDRRTNLPLQINKEGIYVLKLYDVKGGFIKELFKGLLLEGKNSLPLELISLPAGMYILKMSNGTQTRERAIIIGE